MGPGGFFGAKQTSKLDWFDQHDVPDRIALGRSTTAAPVRLCQSESGVFLAMTYLTKDAQCLTGRVPRSSTNDETSPHSDTSIHHCRLQSDRWRQTNHDGLEKQHREANETWIGQAKVERRDFHKPDSKPRRGISATATTCLGRFAR